MENRKSSKADNDIDIILDWFEEKKTILQNLADYKNTVKSIRLNLIMTLLTAMTLLFVIFPDKAKEIANILSGIWNFIMSKL